MQKDPKRGSLPLTNPKKEAFCKLYAAHFWGDPAGAVKKAGLLAPESQDAFSLAEELFGEESIRDRIVFLRTKRASVSVADEAWIRELLVEIATHAAKDSDRIRALLGLAKVITGESRQKRSKEIQCDDFDVLELPLFQGCPDGSGDLPDDPET